MLFYSSFVRSKSQLLYAWGSCLTHTDPVFRLSVTILAFSQVTDKTINTKVRFLTSTFMVTLQLTRVAERERHSMIRTQRESSFISRQLIPILLRIIIQWRLTITFTFVKSIFRSGTTQSPSSAITR